ncbi:hypothetical protein B4U37_11045 [Sutcliffiella horikoshii]|uniref:Protein-glutamine gamma-glutamyltransferase-like C-terminal domain-containing protein n=1 Tax=Sutcliffiella horikoshii TaxID=79883 RepID=A0ABN4ZE32_9BACI|nr:DUF4129 domain-containing protein [Sutcliffiella horikoshii]ART76540.1 hypothetical protein B4U37_11045 [Sutcliffiella horikoshii]
MLTEPEAREQLEEILDQQEYQVYYADTRNTLQIWWDEFKAWLADLLSRLFPSMENTSGTAGNIMILVIILVIVILGAFVITYLAKNNPFGRNKKNKPFQSGVELEWSFQQHVNEAKKFEEVGDFSLATRHLFLGLLLNFHERQWLEAKIWKTNWEYYDELRREQKELAQFFFDFALLFDRATYGKQKIEKDDYLSFRDIALKWLNDAQQEI